HPQLGEPALELGAGEAGWPVVEPQAGRGVLAPLGRPRRQRLVDDEALAAWPTEGREYAPASLWLYDWPASLTSTKLERGFTELGMEDSSLDVAGRFLMARMVRESFGLSMFAGVFVSLLFFIEIG